MCTIKFHTIHQMRGERKKINKIVKWEKHWSKINLHLYNFLGLAVWNDELINSINCCWPIQLRLSIGYLRITGQILCLIVHGHRPFKPNRLVRREPSWADQLRSEFLFKGPSTTLMRLFHVPQHCLLLSLNELVLAQTLQKYFPYGDLWFAHLEAGNRETKLLSSAVFAFFFLPSMLRVNWVHLSSDFFIRSY